MTIPPVNTVDMEARYLALVGAIRAELPDDVSPLAAGLLAAAHMGVADDSRRFAQIFDIAHALVLRALSELTGRHGLVDIVMRDPRTQRTAFVPNEHGARLLAQMPA